MADLKISALPASTTPLAGTEVLPIVQSSATKQVSVANLTAGRDVAAKSATLSNTTNGPPLTLINTNGNAGLKIQPATTKKSWLLGAQYNVDETFEITASTAAGGTTFSTPLVTVSTAGNTSITTGNLIIGTSGKGIDFSATSGSGTSELLSDYEEGTWTPIDASGAGLTFANVSAYYTKIGRQVFAHYYFTYPVTVDVTANAVGGLPFTASNDNAARGGSAVTYNEMNAFISIYGPRNGTAWQYVNGVGNGYTNAQLSGKTFMGCITYFV